MTDAFPVQKFRLGDRVQAAGPLEIRPFVICWVRVFNGIVDYSGHNRGWYTSDDLTLAPKRRPYFPSERAIVHRTSVLVDLATVINGLYRCETDAELAARHQRERDHYDLPDVADAEVAS